MIIEVGKLGEATFSDDRRYRYLLTRHCGNASPSWWMTFVMLNPSTADHDENDPTIAKCLKFANRYCEGWQGPRELLGVRIVNIFAFRATDPKECFAEKKPVGGVANDEAIMMACLSSQLVVWAWGADEKSRNRAGAVRAMLVGAGLELYRIGEPAKGGAPQHPLYRPDDTALERMA